MITILKKIKNKFLKKKANYNLHLYEKYSHDDIKNKRFVNLGSGIFNHPYWTCVDIAEANENMYPHGFPKDYIDLNFSDPKFVLPFNNSSIKAFYCSHCIEHINTKSIQRLFDEVYRSLDREGIIRITCPDINLALNALKNNDKYFFDPENKNKDKNIFELFFNEWVDPICKYHGNVEYLQKGIRDKLLFEESFLENLFEPKYKKSLNGHINFLNENKIKLLLTQSGFKKIFFKRYNQSNNPIFLDLKFFDVNYYNLSLYVEAIK